MHITGEAELKIDFSRIHPSDQTDLTARFLNRGRLFVVLVGGTFRMYKKVDKTLQ